MVDIVSAIKSLPLHRTLQGVGSSSLRTVDSQLLSAPCTVLVPSLFSLRPLSLGSCQCCQMNTCIDTGSNYCTCRTKPNTANHLFLFGVNFFHTHQEFYKQCVITGDAQNPPLQSHQRTSVSYFVFETLFTKNMILVNVENICAIRVGFHTPHFTVSTIPLKCKHV